MELIGKVVKLGNLTEGTSAKGAWRKQELILETDEQYPKPVCLLCWGDRAAEAANLPIGQMVKVQISVESREYNGKWYTDARAWRFDPVGQSAPQFQASHAVPPNANAPAAPEDYYDSSSDNGDDLPF
jgi:Protein of unknown function (DUF3127).